MRLVKIRWMGQEPIQVMKHWLYSGNSESTDIKLNPDDAETVMRKHGKENWIVLRDPTGLLGEKIQATPADGRRMTEALKERGRGRSKKPKDGD